MKRLLAGVWVAALLTAALVQAADEEAQREAARHTAAGVAAKRAGRLDEAATELRQAVALDPESVAAHYALAWVYAEQRDAEGAVGEFEEVVRLAPDTAEARQARAAIERLQKAPARPGRPGPEGLGGLDEDGVSHAAVTVPMVFPVAGGVRFDDTFLADRDGGRRRHHGQDLCVPKHTPLVAVFDGVVYPRADAGTGGHNRLRLVGNDGWVASYLHMNNDTPGTDDGLGTAAYAFAPGLATGTRVVAGQLLGWVGDSGNAEGTVPHLHFELSREGAVVNAFASLRAARPSPAARFVPPHPELRPQPGEVRWDATVEQVDLARAVLVVGVAASTEAGGATLVKARRGWAKWDGEPRLVALDGGRETLRLADMQPGMALVVLGRPDGAALVAREAWVAAGSRR